MLKLFFLVVFAITTNVNCQTDFDNAISQLIAQWGQITPEQYQQLLASFQQNGLNHIWHGLNEHCSSNYECGPGACCLKPTIQGKRAITDGSGIHLASYCAKLRQAGESCSNYDTNAHYYNFHCPCEPGLRCVAGSTVSLHPSLTIQTQAICKY